MKFAKLYAGQPEYLRGRLVNVEVDIARGLHSFSIVGMASKSVDEARDRVSSALKNSGFSNPKTKNEKLVVSLSPAELKKEGAYYDVAVALGYLLASGEIHCDVQNKLFIGELSLDGTIRPLQGILPIVQMAADSGIAEVYVPAENAREAALVSGIIVYSVDSLGELVRHLDDQHPEHTPLQSTEYTELHRRDSVKMINFSDIRGQAIAKRGLEIAAAGGHNVCMFGPPGTGKTMLARAFTGILPELNQNEMLEVMGIHSVAGQLVDLDMMVDPPLRTPHHTSSYVAIVGGGAVPRPGEITLAHRGVLFLDEFPEFESRVLESLRQPLEDKIVTVSRARGTVQFPADVILLSAMNPCPCGFYASAHGTCICSAADIARYKKKISGPIMDRIDIWLPVEHIDYEKLTNSESDGENSVDIQARVRRARLLQQNRSGKTSGYLNSSMSSRDVQSEFLDPEVSLVLQNSARKLQLSPRAYHRVIKLARTIADLESSEHIQKNHILEALQYRPQIQ